MQGKLGVDKAVAQKWELTEKPIGFAINRDGKWVGMALADGRFAMLRAEDLELAAMQYSTGHDGVSLSFVADSEGHAFLSGGDDGRVLLIDPVLAVPTEIVDAGTGASGMVWVDHVAAHENGMRAYSIGKDVYLLSAEGDLVGAPRAHKNTVEGLAFSPNGKRLAAAHYEGVSLWWTNAPESAAEVLACGGAHALPTWHPSGDMVLTSMQEKALHGWRLDSAKKDKGEMHMQGYGHAIKSMRFTNDKRYLVTSGMSDVVCWPFFDGGPWEKEPMLLGGQEGRIVSAVAPHPSDPMVAAGYNDGLILLAPFDGREPLLVYPPGVGNCAVVGMGWLPSGDGLFAAREDGIVLLFTLASLFRAMRQGR